MLGMVALALFFESYDLSLGTSALKHIAEDLGIGADELGGTLSIIRLGAIPAFLLAPFADRVGRRRVFLACVIGASVATFGTAFARTTAEFVVMQMLTRTALVLGTVVAIVIIIEELPAAHRGWALGVMGALASGGHGLGAALFAAIDSLPYGWRSLYALGILPLFFMPYFRANVTETTRFRQHAASHVSRGGLREWLGPMVSLSRLHPGRTVVMAAIAGLLGLGEVAVFQFTGYYALSAHGWSPGQYSAMIILGGGVGIVGNVFAGRLGDRIGRRRVGAMFLMAMPAFAITYYNGPSWVLPVAFAGFVFCETSAAVVVRAFSSELFPTSHRGTSTGWAQMLQVLGWALGLWIVGIGSETLRDIVAHTSVLACTTVVAAALLLTLPETNQRELESLSVEGTP